MKPKYLYLIVDFYLGDGVWEGIRLHKSKLVFIDEHLDRLFNSAHGISSKYSFIKRRYIYEIKKYYRKMK